MKRRIIRHPSRLGLLDSHGIGGPSIYGPGRPGLGPRAQPPSFSNPFDITKTISDALGAAFQRAVNDLLSPGEVLLGAVLIVVGLLVATGQMGKVGKAGVFVASRGAIK